MSLSLNPIGRVALAPALERRVRARAGALADLAIRRGADNVTIVRLGADSDRFITLKVVSDHDGAIAENIVRVSKNHRSRGGKKGARR